MFDLLIHTPHHWSDTVLNEFDRFLCDHAACERKASGMAMSMVAHYPDQTDIVTAMVDLAIEELHHFREVVKLLNQRGVVLQPDEKDPYVNELRRAQRKGRDAYLMDRLLIASIVEARGHERFGIVADALEPGNLKTFYQAITASEARHYELFLQLCLDHFEHDDTYARLDQLLQLEADIVKSLPIRAALH